MRISDWSSDVCSSDLIFHQKFIIRDSGGSRRALLTGSTNFTPTGTGSHGTRKNLNHLVILHDQWVCNDYDAEFAEIWQGTFGKLRSRHGPSQRNNTVAGVSVRALFAPDHADRKSTRLNSSH